MFHRRIEDKRTQIYDRTPSAYRQDNPLVIILLGYCRLTKLFVTLLYRTIKSKVIPYVTFVKHWMVYKRRRTRKSGCYFSTGMPFKMSMVPFPAFLGHEKFSAPVPSKKMHALRPMRQGLPPGRPPHRRRDAFHRSFQVYKVRSMHSNLSQLHELFHGRSSKSPNPRNFC